MNDGIDVRSRQDPLRKHYRESPEDARITDRGKTTGGTGMDPFHGQPGTSHVTFRHPSGAKLTVPARRPIKQVYVKKFLGLIDEVAHEKD